MAERDVNARIRQAYEATSGSKLEVFEEVNKGKDKKQNENKHRASEAMVPGEQAHTKEKKGF